MLFSYVHFQINYRLFVLIIRIKHGPIVSRKFDGILSFVDCCGKLLLMFITRHTQVNAKSKTQLARKRENQSTEKKSLVQKSTQIWNNDSHNNDLNDGLKSTIERTFEYTQMQ